MLRDSPSDNNGHCHIGDCTDARALCEINGRRINLRTSRPNNTTLASMHVVLELQFANLEARLQNEGHVRDLRQAGVRVTVRLETLNSQL